MSLVEELHAAHKARLARMVPPAKQPVVEAAPAAFVPPIPTQENVLKPVWFTIEESPPPPDIMVADITRAVCKYFDITGTALKGKRRTHNVVYPRQIAMHLARQHTTRSLPEIGRRMGNRDHTTVLHGARKIAAESQRNWLVAYDVAHIEATL